MLPTTVARCAQCHDTAVLVTRQLAGAAADDHPLILTPPEGEHALTALGMGLGDLRRADRLLTVHTLRCSACSELFGQVHPRARPAYAAGCLPLLGGLGVGLLSPIPLMPAFAVGLALAWPLVWRHDRRERARLAARWPDLPAPRRCPACDSAAIHRLATVSSSRRFPCRACGAQAVTHGRPAPGP